MGPEGGGGGESRTRTEETAPPWLPPSPMTPSESRNLLNSLNWWQCTSPPGSQDDTRQPSILTHGIRIPVPYGTLQVRNARPAIGVHLER